MNWSCYIGSSPFSKRGFNLKKSLFNLAVLSSAFKNTYYTGQFWFGFIQLICEPISWRYRFKKSYILANRICFRKSQDHHPILLRSRNHLDNEAPIWCIKHHCDFSIVLRRTSDIRPIRFIQAEKCRTSKFYFKAKN